MTEALLEVHNLVKKYPATTAVDGVSLAVPEGICFGLLGPNGSGKTSSIRMMIGITAPDSGTVSLFGKPFTRKMLANIGYLPEERGLYKKMNVLEQLVFLGRLHYISASVATIRARTWADRLQISEALPKKTEDLSKGMQQKIQFIAALMHEPELIIMDEPFSGLDPVNASLLMDTLVELRQEGKTILFSTHRMDQVEKMCDKLALIHGGKLVLSGSMGEIKASYPRNRIHIAFDGDDAFLRHPHIERLRRFNGQAEIVLRPSSTLVEDAQALLVDALRHARVTRFEVTEPTLEEIFIEKVRETSPKEEINLSADAEEEEPEGSYLNA